MIVLAPVVDAVVRFSVGVIAAGVIVGLVIGCLLFTERISR